MKKGLEKGLKKGLKKGREEKRQREQEIARNLKNIGVSVSNIAAATGLSADEIEEL